MNQKVSTISTLSENRNLHGGHSASLLDNTALVKEGVYNKLPAEYMLGLRMYAVENKCVNICTHDEGKSSLGSRQKFCILNLFCT